MDWVVEASRAGVENAERHEVKNRKDVSTVLSSVADKFEGWDGPTTVVVFPYDEPPEEDADGDEG